MRKYLKMIKIGRLTFQHLPVILAPMDGITTSPFRQICRQMNADWTYSEFISAEGIIRKDDHYARKINFLPNERPFSLQIFTNSPENIKRAIEIVEVLRPDFIDINMGCPVKKIISKGAGAALLKTPELMIKIAKAATATTNIPITIKTRIGWDYQSIIIEELAPKLQDAGIAALIVHARTKTQLFSGKANWEILARLANNPFISIPIIGNGDISTVEQAISYPQLYGVKGVMIGRAAIGNPFVFKQIAIYRSSKEYYQVSLSERIETLKKFIILSLNWFGSNKTIFELRKHYKNFFSGFPHFKKFKMQLMNTQNESELFDIIDNIQQTYSHIKF